jgi:hypothetical protein
VVLALCYRYKHHHAVLRADLLSTIIACLSPTRRLTDWSVRRESEGEGREMRGRGRWGTTAYLIGGGHRRMCSKVGGRGRCPPHRGLRGSEKQDLHRE